jgi:hypothetical protein
MVQPQEHVPEEHSPAAMQALIEDGLIKRQDMMVADAAGKAESILGGPDHFKPNISVPPDHMLPQYTPVSSEVPSTANRTGTMAPAARISEADKDINA